MRQNTPKYELVQLRLGRSLAKYVEAARDDRRSWRTIADDVSALSGVTISWETLRDWFKEPAEPTDADPAATEPAPPAAAETAVAG